MAIVVEIHVPLAPAVDVPPEAYPFPWIEDVEEFLTELEEDGALEVYDVGEEHEGHYVFFVTGADEAALLDAAARVADLRGVPGGAFAMVTDDQAPEFGLGRRVELAA